MRRTILPALVFVLSFGFAAQANAHAATTAFSLEQTAWMTSCPDQNGNQVGKGMVFLRDGTFFFMTMQGGKIDKIQGSYHIDGDTLKVNVNGQNIEITLVSQNGDQLVTEGKNGFTRWERVRE